MIKSFKVGDVLSESSHYKVLADNGNLNFKLKHLESGDVVYIDEKYIHNYLESADDFTNEVKVTREDKKDGTLGIRSIFEGIHGSQFPYPKVLDPDGWDRKNYDYSWKEEKITLEEYEARRSQSTCVYSIITERMFEKGVD